MGIRVRRRRTLPWIFTILAVLSIGCSDSATAPSDLAGGAPSVSDPEILVGGIPVRGIVTAGNGEASLFAVRVHAPSGLSSIARVVMQYSQPGSNYHGGPMMGGYNGTSFCYDDGTHGDDVAGDGIYHFMDPERNIGCHGLAAPPGEYRYAFWCEDRFGQRSNTVSIAVTRQ